MPVVTWPVEIPQAHAQRDSATCNGIGFTFQPKQQVELLLFRTKQLISNNIVYGMSQYITTKNRETGPMTHSLAFPHPFVDLPISLTKQVDSEALTVSSVVSPQSTCHSHHC